MTPRSLRTAVLWVSLAMLALSALDASPAATSQRPPQRIISVIPAVTEMLFAIGAGPQVVAVGSFDHYPAAVEKLPRVGALLDPDVERILSLEPDLVAIYGSQTDLRTQLARAGVATYVYRHSGLADVTVTMRELGARTGHAAQADRLASSIESRIDAVRRQTAGARRPRTLIVFGREAGALRGIYASGGVGFIHDMVTAAGGENVFADVKKEAVQATSELILARQPEVVLELRITAVSADQLQREIAVWNALPSLPAVRNHKVHIINDPRTVVPGPRIAEGVELLAGALAGSR